MSERSCIIIPVLGNPELSEKAVHSALRQEGVGDLHVLAIDVGDDKLTREMLEELVAISRNHVAPPTFHLWQHSPPLKSLAATWNAGLRFAWEIGCEDALVINNDVELPDDYYKHLRERMFQDKLGFLSGVGVDKPLREPHPLDESDHLTCEFQLHPDFSAYLITRGWHWTFPFDENFVPAYLEDLCAHRRALLADRGREIGKINVPFVHYSSGTLKARDPEARRKLEDQISNGSRMYYRRKWGMENAETRAEPFGPNVPYPVDMDTLRNLAAAGVSVRQYVQRGYLEVLNEEPHGETERPEPAPRGGPWDTDTSQRGPAPIHRPLPGGVPSAARPRSLPLRVGHDLGDEGNSAADGAGQRQDGEGPGEHSGGGEPREESAEKLETEIRRAITGNLF